MNQRCKVCEEPAAGFHFGAFTCEGCKSFFGRAHSNPAAAAAVECKTGAGRCVIDKHSRTSCKACRLKKCLAAGMSKSGSRYGRRSNWFKIHCLLQQQRRRRRLIARCDGDGDGCTTDDGCGAKRTPPPRPLPALAAAAMAMPLFGFAPWAAPLPRSERSAFRRPSRGVRPDPGVDDDDDDDEPVDLTVVARPTTTDGGGGDETTRAAAEYYYYRRYYCCGPLRDAPLDLTGGGRNFDGIRS